MSWYSIFTPPSATVYSSFSASRRPPFATVQRTSPPFLIEGGTNLKRLNCVFVEVGGGVEVGGVWENAEAEKSRRATTRSMKERLRSCLIVHSSLLLLRLYPTAARPRCGRSRCARGDRCGSSPETS